MPDNTPSWEEAATEILDGLYAQAYDDGARYADKTMPEHWRNKLVNIPRTLTALNAAVKELVIGQNEDTSIKAPNSSNGKVNGIAWKRNQLRAEQRAIIDGGKS